MDNSAIINDKLLVNLAKYLRFVNYIGAAELYLKDNFLLTEPLQKEHVKDRILGHWGTVPGINFVYANLNILAKKHQQEFMLVVGPGHGYPALLANLYLEGTLGEYYPDYQHSKEGFEQVIRNFSWPSGFPSHSNPETPGVILEGGELGYSLASAYGASFDNPDLIVACIVGDGEAETGPLAAAWQSNKFINPAEDGAVLPIVHVNKYKISGPTIFGTMSEQELTDYFTGLGYQPYLVSGDFLYESMLAAMENAYQQIKAIQTQARNGEPVNKPAWPVIVFINKKGWTGPKEVRGKMIEDSFRSHGVPLEKVHEDEEEFQALKDWLESYKIHELMDHNYIPISEITELLPPEELRIGRTKHANGGEISKPLLLPDSSPLEVPAEFRRNDSTLSNMAKLSDYLRELIKLNPDNFRLMSPDETESNKLSSVFQVTKRRYYWPVPEGSENINADGRVMEILSEHTLQGWLEGYTLTGRHGIFITYEAFGMIVASMIDQYTKFLKQAQLISWRKPVPSLNIVLTSSSWRQDHNGFSHQNPGLISSLLNDYSRFVRVHFPVDANMLLATMDEAFCTKNIVNLIVTGKREVPQYLSLAESKEMIKTGVNVWDFVGNNQQQADVVFVATGDNLIKESIAAIQILKQDLPELNTRFVAVSELTCFGIGDNATRNSLEGDMFTQVFGTTQPIIYAYHGYPEDIKQLIFGHPDANRFRLHGYIEKGTTTTPFDMLVKNICSRYQLALEAIELAGKNKPELKPRFDEVSTKYQEILAKHTENIKVHGIDIPEVTEFNFDYS